jgi:hypothetical protein
MRCRTRFAKRDASHHDGFPRGSMADTPFAARKGAHAVPEGKLLSRHMTQVRRLFSALATSMDSRVAV